MSEEAFSSLVSSTMHDWFPPAVLFLFLNLMIASIAISSKLSSSSSSSSSGSSGDHETIEQNRHRRPSNSSSFEPPKEPLPGSPSVLGRIEPSDFRISMADQREPEHEQETEETNDESYEEIYGNIKANDAQKIREEQEAAPSMRSSRALKSDSGKYQQCECNGGGGKLEEDAVVEEDEGVDARADDFINRFKQQLKLQRLESLSRYRVMVGLS